MKRCSMKQLTPVFLFKKPKTSVSGIKPFKKANFKVKNSKKFLLKLKNSIVRLVKRLFLEKYYFYRKFNYFQKKF